MVLGPWTRYYRKGLDILCQVLLPRLSMSYHVHDEISQTFPLHFCILQVIKNGAGEGLGQAVMSLHHVIVAFDLVAI